MVLRSIDGSCCLLPSCWGVGCRVCILAGKVALLWYQSRLLSTIIATISLLSASDSVLHCLYLPVEGADGILEISVLRQQLLLLRLQLRGFLLELADLCFLG